MDFQSDVGIVFMLDGLEEVDGKNAKHVHTRIYTALHWRENDVSYLARNNVQKSTAVNKDE
eukprot:scaffold1377_cov126-Cylindrotheca_fusiformis.AAC.21